MLSRCQYCIHGRRASPLDPETHHLVKERADAFASAPSKSVVLVVTRKPRRTASRIPSTAMS